MGRQRRRRTKKEIKCPICGGTGKISEFVTIDEMSNLQLAKEVHKRVVGKWTIAELANSIVALAYKLKTRLEEDC